jgi:hypothetical protein
VLSKKRVIFIRQTPVLLLQSMRGGDDFLLPRASPVDSDASSGERIAVCLLRQYPTLRGLWDAYRACSTDKQRAELVQDVEVTPAVGPAGRAVRVGPALSKALFQAIWQTHGAPSDAATGNDHEDADDD